MDWDFNWRGQYRYAEPIELPAGTRIEMVAGFDYSAANPHNPNSPTKAVSWGGQTADEMAFCFFDDTSADAKAPGRMLFAMAKHTFFSRF